MNLKSGEFHANAQLVSPTTAFIPNMKKKGKMRTMVSSNYNYETADA
jgi:hypothetical protein